MNPRYLVLGASGFIGGHLVAALGRENVIATYCNSPVPGGKKFDAVTSDLSEIVDEPGSLSHAFLLQVYPGIDGCASEPERARALNVASVQKALLRLADWGVMPVFASTDVVFDGSGSDYRESDPVNPILTYGRHKAEIEEFLANQGVPYLACRFAKVVSDRGERGEMIGDWLAALDGGHPLRLAHDQFTTPIGIGDVIATVMKLVERGATGVYHLGGPMPCSRWSLFEMLLREYRCFEDTESDFAACSIGDFGFIEKRPLNTSLNSEKARKDSSVAPMELGDICRRAVARHFGARQ